MKKKDYILLRVLFAAIVICGVAGGVAHAQYPFLLLDVGNSNMASRTEAGFTPFTIADSGSTIDGITVEIAPITGSIDARFRDVPTGIPYELLYRDFVFTRPGGMRLTLSGLEPNETYQITIYAYDNYSTSNRIADWTDANTGELVLTTSFAGGQPPADEDDRAFSGTTQSDENGTIVLEAGPNPDTVEESGASNPYAFINALVVSSLTPVNVARRPVPEDGAIITTPEIELQWTPGNTSVSSNVYVGEDFDDVNEATTENTDIFRGNTTEISFPVGSAGNPYPDGLSEETTYYWRIDEVEEDGTQNKGNVWSFTVAPKTAFAPVPVVGSLYIDPNVTLQWTPGAGSVEHRVFFGDNLEDIQAGTGGTDKGTVTEPNYATGLLERDKIYYWRIDESDGTDTYTGDVWSFTTTLNGLGTIGIDIWEGTFGPALDTLLDDALYPDSPTRSEVLTEMGTQLIEGTEDSYEGSYGAQIYGWLYVPVSGDYTFYFTSADEGELWLSTDDDPGNIQMLANEPVWGSYDTFSHITDPVPLLDSEKYYIMARWVESSDWDHCQVAWQGPGIPTMEVIQGSFLSPYMPVNAFGASPSSSSTDNRIDPVLTWKTGIYAGSHIVYFGTDPNDLEQVAVKQAGDETYTPERLEMETTYYWRVDEVNDTDPNSPWVGDTWSFTTGSYLVVDDFEDYNDYEPDRIFDKWIDGYGTTTNGSTAGYPDPDFPAGEHFVETTIVNGGSQSMPYFYDNNMKFSEAVKTLESERDWTDKGVETLSLWFQGIPGNVGGFTEDPAGTYTMTASGTDIEGTSDEFHFAYKQLTGVGSITARVLSVENTDPWAKAGVMIRSTLDPDSNHAMMVVTPGQGVSFQRRPSTSAATSVTTETDIMAPQWVRIERDLSGNFIASYSDNGSTWTQLGTDSINMSSPAYIGLALTSHNVDATCEAVFSNVTITGNVSQGPWEDQDIGILSNVPEQMYVVLNESAVVYNDDPDASLINAWTEWRIDLQEFADQGVDLTDVDSIGLGFGERNNPQAGGSGLVYFDDIRLYRP
jgi:hypothetical protein